MSDTILKMRLIILVVFTAIGSLVWLVPQQGLLAGQNDYLKVHFLDVGQGDAILIETPDGVQVLIDGGPDSGILRGLGEEMLIRDRTVDLVVRSHPDKDHVGGLSDVLDRYDVATVLITENKGGSSASRLFEKLILDEGAELIYARSGQEFSLGASTTLRVLFPDIDPTEMESNTASIVLQLVYGDVEFMLTGDSPKSIEEYLVSRDGERLESEVLKVGHHGSRTSTSELFLEEVSPEYAVISVGENNRYGHPNVEVTDMLFNEGVETLSTAEYGTITFLSDGKEVWVE